MISTSNSSWQPNDLELKTSQQADIILKTKIEARMKGLLRLETSSEHHITYQPKLPQSKKIVPPYMYRYSLNVRVKRNNSNFKYH